ncbi:MAG: hypothetical protein ACI8QF_003294, partial [Limisphaerales bacterium]
SRLPIFGELPTATRIGSQFYEGNEKHTLTSYVVAYTIPK